jgi:hypothetical protein
LRLGQQTLLCIFLYKNISLNFSLILGVVINQEGLIVIIQ